MKLMGKMEDLLKLNKSNEDKTEEIEITKVEITKVEDTKYVKEEIQPIRRSECLIEHSSRLKNRQEKL